MNQDTRSIAISTHRALTIWTVLFNQKYIIYPNGDDDVIKAIIYAKAKNIAVAVRTGGHQYSGASSTYGDNIQLALSNTYVDFKWENTDCTSVTVGISYSLNVFNAKLRGKKRFVPHGQCSHVHLGGYVQTGGYGQLGRSFGLLADHVQKFRIITAEGQPREIHRGVVQDKDLFFAVIGGSPGNFGVLTHVTLKVYCDDDHQLSRGHKIIYLYDGDRLKRLLDVMVRMANDKSFPADYDYCVTMLSAASLVLSSFTPDLDVQMRQDHPDLYGDDGRFLWPPIIVVYAQWANLEGKGQIYDGKFFNEIKLAGGEDQGIPFLGIRVDDSEPKPLSELTSDWIFPNVREFEMLYIKCIYMSNSETLETDQWTDWVCDRIHEIQRNPFNGCYLSVQIQHFGGDKSRCYQNSKNGTTSFSWRDSSLCCVLDCFHCGYASPKDTAEQWQHENDTGVGRNGARFCTDDRRVLWGSHDLNLDTVHEYYYDDSPTKHQRLCRIKREIDPEGLFTPNGFCVGAQPITRRISSAAEMLTSQLESASIARRSLPVLERTHPTISIPLLDRLPEMSVASIRGGAPCERTSPVFGGGVQRW